MRAIGSVGLVLLVGCGGASSAPDELVIDGELTIALGPRAAGDGPMYTVFATGTEGQLGEPLAAAPGDVVEVGVQGGGAVTAVYESATEVVYVTYWAIEPGDELTVGNRPPRVGDNPRSLTVTWPALAGATGYRAITACGELGAGTLLQLTAPYQDSCEPDPATDVLLIARDGDTIVGWARLDDVPLGTSAAVSAWLPPAGFTVMASAPPGFLRYDVEVSPVVEDYEIPFVTTAGDSEDPPSIPGAHPWVHGTETRVVTHVTDDGSPDGEWWRSDVLPGDADGWTLDLDVLTPDVRSFAFTDRSFRWMAEDDGYDGAVVIMRWIEGARSHHYVVIAPPASAIPLPPFPEPLVEPTPPTSSSDVDKELQLHDFDDDPDHAAMRARPEWQLRNPRGPGRIGTWTERYSSTVIGDGEF